MPGVRRWTTRLALLALTAGAPVAAFAQATEAPRPAPAADHPFAPFVAEAAERFGLPEHWIWAVMRAESAGRPQAVSRAGAMGLMQIMPATWTELRSRYGLGHDPFDVRDNILAGSAYLQEMHDRFGSPGFLAAYNAGPARYERHLATGRPLPAETRAYLAALTPMTGAGRIEPPGQRPSDAQAWRHAPLFIVRAGHRSDDTGGDDQPSDETRPDDGSSSAQMDTEPPVETLFFPLSGQTPRP